MNHDAFTTPISRTASLNSTSLRSSAPKRDSLAAELERDPQLSTAKRKQRTQVFTSHMAHASLERQLLAAQTAKAELETKLRTRDTELDEMKRNMATLVDSEETERMEREREQLERQHEKLESDKTIHMLKTTLADLEGRYAELQDAYFSHKRSWDHANSKKDSQIMDLQRQVQVLNAELVETKEVAASRSQDVETLQMELENLSVAQEKEAQRAVDDENLTVVRGELQRQAEYLQTVETENIKIRSELTVLRRRQANAEILKEQIRELERKARGADEAREEAVKLKAKLEASRKEVEEWASRKSTPASTSKSLTELRLNLARLAEERDSAVALAQLHEKDLTDAQSRLAEEQILKEKFKSELELLKTKAERQVRRTQLTEREVGYLKAMLASYEAEEAAEDDSKVDEAAAERIRNLEVLVSDYKATLDQMQKEIEDLGGDPSTLGGGRPRGELQSELAAAKAAAAKAEQDLAESEAEIVKNLEQIEELEQTLFDLRGEIGGGRHVPPGVRILSLRDNPAQQWADLSQAAMDRLKTENEALLKRLKDLESSGVVSDTGAREELVPRESWEAVTREKEDLQETLKQKEKRLMRLQQVFAAKSEEFKETIASILGVKLAFYPNGQVRVTSQFDLNAAFVFQPSGPNEGTRMQLVAQGDGGPQDLPQLMHYWVEQEQCIPGFLASVTLECYEKRKSEQGL